MTMHLVRGMSSLNTKKRKSKKLDMQKVEVEWRRYNKDMRRKNLHSLQFDTLQEYVDYIQGKSKPRKQEFKEYAPNKSFIRDTPKYPSRQTSDAIPESCAKREPNQYSGDYVVGIATMHKSNLVPVGRGDDPKEYSTMRRN